VTCRDGWLGIGATAYRQRCVQVDYSNWIDERPTLIDRVRRPAGGPTAPWRRPAADGRRRAPAPRPPAARGRHRRAAVFWRHYAGSSAKHTRPVHRSLTAQHRPPDDQASSCGHLSAWRLPLITPIHCLYRILRTQTRTEMSDGQIGPLLGPKCLRRLGPTQVSALRHYPMRAHQIATNIWLLGPRSIHSDNFDQNPFVTFCVISHSQSSWQIIIITINVSSLGLTGLTWQSDRWESGGDHCIVPIWLPRARCVSVFIWYFGWMGEYCSTWRLAT